MKILLTMASILVYAAVAGFLCAAAIAHPGFSEAEQFVWCAVAVGWGPLVAVVFWMLFWS